MPHTTPKSKTLPIAPLGKGTAVDRSRKGKGFEYKMVLVFRS